MAQINLRSHAFAMGLGYGFCPALHAVAIDGGISLDAIRCPALNVEAVKIQIAYVQPEEVALTFAQQFLLTAVAAAA